jgi:hypothetical protein
VKIDELEENAGLGGSGPNFTSVSLGIQLDISQRKMGERVRLRASSKYRSWQWLCLTWRRSRVYCSNFCWTVSFLLDGGTSLDPKNWRSLLTAFGKAGRHINYRARRPSPHQVPEVHPSLLFKRLVYKKIVSSADCVLNPLPTHN